MKKLILALMLVGLLIGPTAVFAAPNLIEDPTAGTIIGRLAPGPEGAHGRAVINYAKGRDCFEVQLSVTGLEPNTEYSLYLHKPGGPSGGEWVFTTNAGGNGGLHLRTDEIGQFDRINVREPFKSNSGVLSTAALGGSLRQVPSRRSK